MLRTGFEDTCYELIPLVKSGDDNQKIQLIKGLIPRCTRLLNILFGWHFASEEWWASCCCLFHALEMYSYSLSFNMITFTPFFLYCIVSPFLSFPDRYPVAWTFGGYWHKHKLEGAVYSPNLGSENPPHEPSIPPYPQETKSSNSSIVIVIKALQRDT